MAGLLATVSGSMCTGRWCNVALPIHQRLSLLHLGLPLQLRRGGLPSTAALAILMLGCSGRRLFGFGVCVSCAWKEWKQ